MGHKLFFAVHTRAVRDLVHADVCVATEMCRRNASSALYFNKREQDIAACFCLVLLASDFSGAAADCVGSAEAVKIKTAVSKSQTTCVLRNGSAQLAQGPC